MTTKPKPEQTKEKHKKGRSRKQNVRYQEHV